MIRQGCLFRKVRICEPGLSPPTFVSGIGHQPSNIQPLYLVCFKIKEFTFHPKLTFMLSFHVFQIWFAVVVAFGFWNVKFLNFWCLHFNIFCKYHCLGKTPHFFFTHRILCVCTASLLVNKHSVVFYIPSNSQTPAGGPCPTIPFSPDTIYWDLASETTGQGLSPTKLSLQVPIVRSECHLTFWWL